MPFFGGGGASAGIGGSTGATDNAILRADGTGGATLQNSALNIDDPISPFSITGVASTDIITAVGHNFTANQGVIFPTLTGGSGLTASTTVYFVRDISGDTFKVSTTSGGSAVNFTTDITAGTVIAIQANVTIKNNHSETNSALVLTPKGTGGFIVGEKPDGTSTGGNARGQYAIDIQAGERSAANQVASGLRAIAIGTRAKASNNDAIAIGRTADSAGSDSISIGRSARSTTFNTASVAVGNNCVANQYSIAIGNAGQATGNNSICLSANAPGITSSAENSVHIGNTGSSADNALRGAFFTLPYRALYWSGTTTNDSATVLNLDGAATNRFTIAANTAAMVDLNIIARRTDTVDKWFSSRRMVAIRRNNANGTAIIGSVQTIGTDQTEGSPTWSVAITADDTNEALQVEVTGAASETVNWRVMAFYQVV